ncbi:MAG: phenylalanine--tRNA ligase subunit alpha, partial [Xanthobacteraceae bacterium]
MSDVKKLEANLLAAIAAAKDEAAIEAVRVAALGKKGSVSELLKTLGTMTAEERKEKGPLINGLKDKVNEAIAAKRAELKR